MMPITFKTELCDGCVHMTAEEFCNHKIKEHDYKTRKALEKLANNPILTTDVQNAILMAIHNMDMMVWWRDRYTELRHRYDAIRKK